MSGRASENVILPAQLDDLPDEVILKLFVFLSLKELLLCGQVSKRLRRIANDESLWIKLNLYEKKVPYDFIEKAAGNGCQYLGLANCDILRFTGKSESSFNLKYLNLKMFYEPCQGTLKLVQNCSSLQKLSISGLKLDSDDIQYICQNSQTLKVLDLECCPIDLGNKPEIFQNLFTNCAHLTELNICAEIEDDISKHEILLDPHIQALVDNLTPTILKVALGDQDNLKDEHVKNLVKRCNNITHLELSSTPITNGSVQSIIKYLDKSLEKLNVFGTNVDSTTLRQLKSMSALKTLICGHMYVDADIENLRQQLPHIRINEEEDLAIDLKESLHIAFPFKIIRSGPGLLANDFGEEWNYDGDWIWETRAKQQNMFAKVETDY